MVAPEHTIAGLDPGDVVTGRDHRADELVTDREAGLDLHPAVVDVQIGAADPARLDPHDRVVARLELGLGPLIELDFTGSLVGDGSQGCKV